MKFVKTSYLYLHFYYSHDLLLTIPHAIYATPLNTSKAHNFPPNGHVFAYAHRPPQAKYAGKLVYIDIFNLLPLFLFIKLVVSVDIPIKSARICMESSMNLYHSCNT